MPHKSLTLATTCPTITTNLPCSTCPMNKCLKISTVTVPCGCTSAIPTSTITHPCSSTSCWMADCGGTIYSTVKAPCPATTPSPTATSTAECPTVTSSSRPSDCTKTCTELACAALKTITWPCSCVGRQVETATVTGCECRTGCATFTQVLYLPCPATPPPGLTTGGAGCLA